MTPRLSRRAAIKAGTGVALASTLPARATAAAEDSNLLWYDAPATEWVQALPLGNGRLGAMVFGGIANERIQLNEDSFFAGSPYDSINPKAGAGLPRVRELIWAGRYREAQDLADEVLVAKPARQMSYQPIGDLLLLFPGIENARSYRRSLDLDGAIAATRFKVRTVTHLREAFASAADRVVALRLTTDAPAGSVNVTLSLSTPQDAEILVEGDDTLVMRGVGPAQHGVPGGIRFETRVHVRRTGGRQTLGRDGIRIEDADEVILLVGTATSFRRFDDIAGDPSAIAKTDIAAAKAKSWPDLLAAHQAEHRRLFRRVSIDLGRSPAAELPTDQRIARSADLDDPALAALYYQYGRYLLISSSRPGTQPANLQGIWNERTAPPWESKWTLNINAEMNYWLADSAHLSELIEPLLRMTEDLAVTGQRSARNDWGARGWVTYHNTDLFRQATVNSAALYGMWPMGGAWLLSTLWDHWDYSRDPAFLARLYPLMTSSCLFYLDALTPHPRTGELVMNPSNSPENSHRPGVSICAGPAMDSQLLRDLFARTIAASKLLGKDAALRAEIAAALAKLPPDRIGKAGQLQEWFDDWDVEAPEINHRHVSHLYALYPGDQISPQRTPELAKAAMRSLEIRGDDATGWGLAWRINLWARLGQRERAYKVLKMLLEPGRTYPNMFDAHPPFQIDGNLGGAAGIGQMLVQSHSGTIHLLPALPRLWPSGRASGLRARGNVGVDISWSAGLLEEAVLSAGSDGAVRVRSKDAVVDLTLRRNERVRLTHGSAGLRASRLR
ncbi:glycoside hydrolase family 95 protein [Sphingomonas sp. DG1-23]|uniref:glycoside hydrolase family 95 protein n=1 Tax=Sphingomonas sp. DG1-23 TaxID=3068316 RepID=UPI00273DC5A8|nr:glycoside hydrolase family 95 protein [Sphingomonas sp. DG1-23]MDP5278954.1 glycoside hydrolase family 95 protein [Sphingomonas sp. DG1-23]